jgi:hypothetical protein
VREFFQNQLKNTVAMLVRLTGDDRLLDALDQAGRVTAIAPCRQQTYGGGKWW